MSLRDMRAYGSLSLRHVDFYERAGNFVVIIIRFIYLIQEIKSVS